MGQLRSYYTIMSLSEPAAAAIDVESASAAGRKMPGCMLHARRA
jgi:hypothetical protein